MRHFAARENISMNHFISLAVAEKLSALATEEYLVKRAKRGSKKKFQRALSKVPRVEPAEYDRL